MAENTHRYEACYENKRTGMISYHIVTAPNIKAAYSKALYLMDGRNEVMRGVNPLDEN